MPESETRQEVEEEKEIVEVTPKISSTTKGDEEQESPSSSVELISIDMETSANPQEIPAISSDKTTESERLSQTYKYLTILPR
ncbi:hypothetical protein ACTXT7_011496 [Hymenolepis weldensis]